jgi:hypothetical protein
MLGRKQSKSILNELKKYNNHMPGDPEQIDYTRLAMGSSSEEETPDENPEAVTSDSPEQAAPEVPAAESFSEADTATAEEDASSPDQREQDAERREQVINPTFKAGLALTSGMGFLIWKGLTEKFGGPDIFTLSDKERQSVQEKGWIKTAQEKVSSTLDAMDGIEDTIRNLAKRTPGSFS